MDSREYFSGDHLRVGRGGGKAIFDATGFGEDLLAGPVAHDDIFESGVAQAEGQLGKQVEVSAHGWTHEGKENSHGLAI